MNGSNTKLNDTQSNNQNTSGARYLKWNALRHRKYI